MLSSADIDVTHKLRVLLKEYVMQCGYKRAVYFEVYIQKNTKASLTKINYNECDIKRIILNSTKRMLV